MPGASFPIVGELTALNAGPYLPADCGDCVVGAIQVSCGEDTARRFAMKPYVSSATDDGCERLLDCCSSAILSVSDDESMRGLDEEDAKLPSAPFGSGVKDVVPLPPVARVKRPPSRSLRRGRRPSELLRASLHPGECASDDLPRESHRDWDISTQTNAWMHPPPPPPSTQPLPSLSAVPRFSDVVSAPLTPNAALHLPEDYCTPDLLLLPPLPSPPPTTTTTNAQVCYYKSLRRFADAMKRSEDTRRHVVMVRRRLLFSRDALGGNILEGEEQEENCLLSGQPWGRSASYLSARRELVADVYSRLLFMLRAPPPPSSSSWDSGSVPPPDRS
jgi:hypothetical protein